MTMGSGGRRPAILIATSFRQKQSLPFEEITLPAGYVAAIERAGGLPILVPPMADGPAWRELAALGKGVLLVGGYDIDPAMYGQAVHPKTNITPLSRTRADCRLVQWADEHNLPLMGVCLGMQTINVCRGGTLNQHVPDDGQQFGVHLKPNDQSRSFHNVRVEIGSRLADIVKTLEMDVNRGRHKGIRIEVNSSHHQAVQKLGRNLCPTAWAEDELVECIEDPRPDRFVLGVQWHPEELLSTALHLALFETLVREAGRRAAVVS